MKTFTKTNYSLDNELMDILANQLNNDPFYQAISKESYGFDNRPQYLQKLKDTLKVRDSERVLTFVENALVFHGTNGMIVTENGIYYKGIMEMAKFTSWYEFMTCPLNILLTNGVAVTLRIKKGITYKPFCPVIGGNRGQDIADFWIRIKETIANYYSLT